MEENYSVINSYWEENSLMDRNSFINFYCTFKIKTQTDFSTSENEARIWLDAGSTHKVQIMDFEKDERKFPTDFWLSNTIMQMDGNTLIISGKHPNPSIGNYEATIIAHRKVKE